MVLKVRSQPDYIADVHTGNTVLEALDIFGLKQNELARRMNKSPNHVNQIVKTGSCTVKVFCDIARALEIKPSALMQIGERFTEYKK